MGLDITAHRQLEFLQPISDEDEDDPKLWDYVQLFIHPDFPGRAAPLIAGYYKAAESTGFRAGGYGGYSVWREWLATLAGYPARTGSSFLANRFAHSEGAWAAKEGPFWELITFSDCEGTIGPIAAAKLAKDFADFEERAKLASGYDQRYQDWRKACEMAADGGAIQFH